MFLSENTEALTRVLQMVNELPSYDEAYSKGYNTGKDEGVEQGKQAEWDRFWDSYQREGESMPYGYAFAGNRWTDETFRPKHNINATNMGYIFRSSGIQDLKGILEQQELKLICASGSVEYFAMGSALTRVPEIICELTVFTNAFNGCTSLVSVDKLNLSTEGSCNCSLAFRNCTALTEIRFNENISPTNLDLHWSPLSHDSLMSLINGLADKTENTSTWQITLGSENLAKLTDAEKAIATEKGWSLV